MSIRHADGLVCTNAGMFSSTSFHSSEDEYAFSAFSPLSSFSSFLSFSSTYACSESVGRLSVGSGELGEAAGQGDAGARAVTG